MLPTVIAPVQGVYRGFRGDRVIAPEVTGKGIVDPEVLGVEALDDGGEERQLEGGWRERRSED